MHFKLNLLPSVYGPFKLSQEWLITGGLNSVDHMHPAFGCPKTEYPWLELELDSQVDLFNLAPIVDAENLQDRDEG